MARRSKRVRAIQEQVESHRQYNLSEAIELLKGCPTVRFDQTVGLSMVLGIDPRKADQQVRGTVALPGGLGKTVRVVVLAKGAKVDEALAAGAEHAGHDELVQKIQDGWTDFDALIATPDMMREVGKLGKILGPRGLMPSPKAGTVTADVATAVREIKAGKVEFRADKFGQVNIGVARLSFSVETIMENVQALVGAVARSKPSAAKGIYLRQVVLSSTMGPGLRISLRDLPGVA